MQPPTAGVSPALAQRPPATPPAVTPLPTRGAIAPEIRLPAGFRAEVFASGIPQTTSLAFGTQGELYVATLEGKVLLLREDPAGGPPLAQVYASGLQGLLGIALGDSELFASSLGRVTILRDRNGDGVADEAQEIISGLPNGRHQNNGLAFGPDGKLYLTLGSTCDVCQERDPRSATILRANPDGSSLEIYARGLRNAYDLAFHPNGDLFATDNGRDDLGFAVPEELNLILPGGHYGWPDCWGMGKGSNCEGTLPPVVELEPRSSADGMAFYSGSQFPTEYHDDLFIAMYGAHTGETGRKVVRVKLTREGNSYRGSVSDFATGFDRPLALAVGPQGDLFVADFGRGRIYRIRYLGG